jgi:hypothetical protein
MLCEMPMRRASWNPGRWTQGLLTTKAAGWIYPGRLVSAAGGKVTYLPKVLSTKPG